MSKRQFVLIIARSCDNCAACASCVCLLCALAVRAVCLLRVLCVCAGCVFCVRVVCVVCAVLKRFFHKSLQVSLVKDETRLGSPATLLRNAPHTPASSACWAAIFFCWFVHLVPTFFHAFVRLIRSCEQGCSVDLGCERSGCRVLHRQLVHIVLKTSR